MTDRENIEALVSEGGYTRREAYFLLIDAGEWQDDETADDLFTPEFLERYPS